MLRDYYVQKDEERMAYEKRRLMRRIERQSPEDAQGIDRIYNVVLQCFLTCVLKQMNKDETNSGNFYGEDLHNILKRPDELSKILSRYEQEYDLAKINFRENAERWQNRLLNYFEHSNKDGEELKKSTGEYFGDIYGDDGPIYKITVDDIFSYISDREMWLRRASMSTTKDSICELAKKLLDVQDTDTFIDYMAGIGKSTIKIVGNKNPRIVCTDTDETGLNILAMLLIMSGKNNARIIKKDISETDFLIEGYKMFIDALGLRKGISNNKEESNAKDVYEIIFDRIKKDKVKRAVILLPSDVIQIEKYRVKDAIKELAEDGHIKAIISLPPISGELSGSNVIVFDAEEQDKILFIEADMGQRIRRDDGGYEALPKKTIAKIARVVKGEEVEGLLYRAVSLDEFRKVGSINVAAYARKTDECAKVEDIAKNLIKLYEDLEAIKPRDSF